MVKIARAGTVKTRLGREIGSVAATAFYRAASEAVIGRLALDPRWRVVLTVAPDTSVATPAWRIARLRFGQGSGDLGRRMQRAFDVLPPGPVIVIGTDIPAIRPRHIATTFRLLGGRMVVLAPTPDGGYWAVGQRRTPRIASPFATIRWSSADTLADTIRGFAGAGVARGPELSDIDDAASWRSVRAWSGRRVLPIG